MPVDEVLAAGDLLRIAQDACPAMRRGPQSHHMRAMSDRAVVRIFSPMIKSNVDRHLEICALRFAIFALRLSLRTPEGQIMEPGATPGTPGATLQVNPKKHRKPWKGAIRKFATRPDIDDDLCPLLPSRIVEVARFVSIVAAVPPVERIVPHRLRQMKGRNRR